MSFIVRDVQQNELSKPWVIMTLPEINISDERTAEALRKRAEEVATVLRTGTTQLIRKRQATMGEALSREGLAANSTALRSQMVRCIFGFSSSEGCQDLQIATCGTCEALCCDFHQLHDLHKDFVNESVLLKQQQARAQQMLTIETAPTVAPAKETRTESNAAKAKGDKPPRRNTWADLLQRYQQLKGKDYEKPAGQKVSDFQLMVEGLEGRQEAAGDNGSSRKSTAPLMQKQVPPSAEEAAAVVASSITGVPHLPSATGDIYAEFQAFQAFMAFRGAAQGSVPNISILNSEAQVKDDDDDHQEFI